MKKILCVTVLGCVLSLSAAEAYAHHLKNDEKESILIKASYALPHKDGEEFRRTLREADEENMQLQQQIAQDHADLYDLLTAQDFDRNAFLKKSKELRDLQDETKENRDETFVSAVTQLTPQERVTLAHAIENGMVTHKTTYHHKRASNVPDQNARSGNMPEAQPQ